MARQTPSGDNVIAFRRPRRAGQASPRDLPLGLALEGTVARLLEIATLSGDNRLTEGPVHPDDRLLNICATTLSVIMLAKKAEAEHYAKLRPDNFLNNQDQDRRRLLNAAAVRGLKHARKFRATTPGGVFAKALLVRASATGATMLAMSLADDLIACDGLWQTLTWPDL
jgi:hypothetical protein